jgi:lipoprotein-releasing system ATP-binding protein
MVEALPLVQLNRVRKDYSGPANTPVSVLRELELTVEPGESIAIIGPSGSGKSTLLQIIGTLDHATDGEVKLEGRDLAGLTPAQIAAIRNQKLGFVFQSHFLLPQCTALENVLVPTLANQTRSAEQDSSISAVARARQLLERLGLGARLDHFPGQLSGGECQRVAVARALINRPLLLLADEPTGSLDHASAGQLVDLLVQLNREEKVALVLATHSRELAGRIGRVFSLKDGRLVQERSSGK